VARSILLYVEKRKSRSDGEQGHEPCSYDLSILLSEPDKRPLSPPMPNFDHSIQAPVFDAVEPISAE